MQIAGKYELLEKIGNGNFSIVYTTRHPTTGATVAVKVMKTHQSIALKQAYLLKTFEHPNIVKLFDFQHDSNSGQSRMVLQYLPQNTLQLYEQQRFGLRQQQVKCVLFQAALGLAYIHERSIIHRDIKPQNILIDKRTAEIKLIDFGLAIATNKISTDYVATRWYRAPQNLLGTKQYTPAIDIFSLACVAVELYLGAPLFPGADNLDQLYKIFNVLGQPNEQNWPSGARKFKELGLRTTDRKGNTALLGLNSVLKASSDKFLNLMEQMLTLNPAQRIASKDMLAHPYFSDVKSIIPPHIFKRYQKDHIQKSRSKEVIQNAQLFINSAKRQANRQQTNDQQMLVIPRRQEETQNFLISPRRNMQNQQKRQREEVDKDFSSRKEIAATNGLSFRGFNQIKTNKISVKQIQRQNQANSQGKSSHRDSRNNSIDSSKPTINIKNFSNSTDLSRKIVRNNLTEPHYIIQRRITGDGRDYRTPQLKNRSIQNSQNLYYRSPDLTSKPIPANGINPGIRTMKSPLVDSLAIDPYPIKSRIISANESARITRNNSQINPHSHRQVVQQFKPIHVTRQRQKVSLSPSGITISQQPATKGFLKHLQKNTEQKETIYTAPLNSRQFQRFKILPSPNYPPPNRQRTDHSHQNLNNSIAEYNRSKQFTGMQLDREARETEWKQGQPPQQKQQQSLLTGQFPFRIHNHIEQHPQKKMVSPESKVKLVKSMEHRDLGDIGSFFQHGRRQQLQRPSIVVMEKKEYRQPRIVTKKYAQNQKISQNLTNFLNGKRQNDRNININLNLSIVDNQQNPNNITTAPRQRRTRI